MALVLCLVGSYAAGRLEVDDDPISLFHADEPIVVADELINDHMRGSNTFDIVIETSRSEGLFDPEKLRRIEELQRYVATLPHIGGSSSPVDYLKQMNRAMNEGASESYRLPDEPDLIAQYFLIYTVMSNPTDLEDIVDHAYQRANIRVSARAGGYRQSREYLEPLAAYLQEEFNSDEMQATITGRVHLNYLWIKELASSHFRGLLLALILVWIVSALLLRSTVAGLYVLAPVALTVVSIYAVMVWMGISLGMGTSMFAAIAIGLGIDFAIHTVDRFRDLAKGEGCDMTVVCRQFYQSTGRALLFNFFAIAGSFGVLAFSKVASLNHFGIMMVVAITTSFVAAMTVLPAMMIRLRPRFLFSGGSSHHGGNWHGAVAWPLVVLLTAIAVPTGTVEARSPGVDEIVARVNASKADRQVTRELTMTLTDRRGKERQQRIITFRKTFADEERTIIFFREPANVRGTGFLIWDHDDTAREDDQWLYLPALRRVRRISASDRGDYFLGTDFTYEDIKLDGRLEPADYDFSLAHARCDGLCEEYQLVGIPRSEAVARELGYSRMEITVDPDRWVITRADFWNLKAQKMKTLEVLEFAKIDGNWTRTELLMRNHLSGHSTRFVFTAIDYRNAIRDGLFTRRALERGL